MTYTPSVVPQVLGAATGVGAATVLPVTGSNLVNTIAIATSAALIVWATMYLTLRKKTS